MLRSVDSYRRFGKTYWSHIQESSSPSLGLFHIKTSSVKSLFESADVNK